MLIFSLRSSSKAKSICEVPTFFKSNLALNVSIRSSYLLSRRLKHIVRWLNAKFRLDRDKSDKSMKFGTQLAYILLKDIRRGAQVKLLIFSF